MPTRQSDPEKPAPAPVVVERRPKVIKDDPKKPNIPHRPLYERQIASPVPVVWTDLTDPEDDRNPKSDEDPEARLVVLKGGRSVSVIWLTNKLPEQSLW